MICCYKIIIQVILGCLLPQYRVIAYKQINNFSICITKITKYRIVLKTPLLVILSLQFNLKEFIYTF